MPDTEPTLLIGVDGGATNVRAHQILVDDGGENFRLGVAHARMTYPDRDFDPVPIDKQLSEVETGGLASTPSESARGEEVVSTIAQCVIDVVRKSGDPAKRVLIGMAMPGLKTKNGRGIAVMNHGPRIPALADLLECRLADAGIKLARRIHRLGSDGDYCGLGEEHGERGAFRDVKNAYYMGGGTGLAEALKIDGQLVTMDQLKDWLPKAWQKESSQGETFERLASAKAMNERFWRITSDEATGTNSVTYPEQLAIEGDACAQRILKSAAEALAELMVDRVLAIVRTLPARMNDDPFFHSVEVNAGPPDVLADRFVLGQQVGRLYADRSLAPMFGDLIDRSFVEQIEKEMNDALSRKYLAGGHLRPGVIVSSQISCAAAIGAGVDAWKAMEEG